MSHELLFNYPRHFSRNTINIKSVAKIICSYFFVKIRVEYFIVCHWGAHFNVDGTDKGTPFISASIIR